MFDAEYFNLGYLDTLSYQDTVIHRLDPRAKLVATIVFIVMVVSFPKYDITGLLPFFLFPVLLLSLGDIPAKFVLKKVLVASSFAVLIGIFNPLLDRQNAALFLGIPISGGWLSFLSIMLKFFLTISSALLLVATTSFPGVCHALQKIGLPEIFVSQLLFLYRYIFVLMEEAMKIVRARDMRSFGRKGHDMKTVTRLIGTLFLRTMERAERVYQAMLSRGFNGRLHSVKTYRFRAVDALFLLATVVLLYLFRVHDVVGALGRLTVRALG
ncbi:MAG TPA: cobalt ECF transporter T component CbiQ [Thermodesulfovibrionales bacterium]|nr:cobalt ECF transporter T component CbiQ [Thermodesulfovibrionales bacterium]